VKGFMEFEPKQPKDALLIQVRQECSEAGQTIFKEYLGRVREVANEGIFCIFQEVGSGGEIVSDELCATFKTPEFLVASSNEKPSPGKIFYLTVFETEDNSFDFKVTFRQPREFTQEEKDRIEARAAELMEIMGDSPDELIL
jgi:hypothetical protein